MTVQHKSITITRSNDTRVYYCLRLVLGLHFIIYNALSVEVHFFVVDGSC